MNHTVEDLPHTGLRAGSGVEEADIVIVGSGIAATSAGLQASRAGAKVILLEKLEEPGGSAALSAGMYWTAPDLDAYRKRVPEGDQSLGAHIIDHFHEGLDVIREMGVTVAETPVRDVMTFGLGYSFDVRGFLEAGWQEIRRRGGRCETGTRVDQLIIEDGEVVGVTAEHEGQRAQYRSRAVILASGGFQGSIEELQQHIPQADRLVFRSNRGSTGDALSMIRQAGVEAVGRMDSFYGHLIPFPLDGEFETGHYLPYSQYYSGATILLNLEGERFIDETLGDEIINQALVRQPDGRGVMIFDERVRRDVATSEPFPGLGELDRYEVAKNSGGNVAEAETLVRLLEETASWGLDITNAAPSIERYARAVRNGRDTGEVRVSPSARTPQDAPFYAVMVQPSITFTFGGAPIDTGGRVIDTGGAWVRGLYAAGADVGKISAVGYAGGLAPAFITGMTAGRNAAADEGSLR